MAVAGFAFVGWLISIAITLWIAFTLLNLASRFVDAIEHISATLGRMEQHQQRQQP